MQIRLRGALLVLAVVAGCQCPNPVPDDDGGVGGGTNTGGGTMGGGSGGGSGGGDVGGGTGGGFNLDGGANDAGCFINITCASAGKNCGPISDGCGNLIDCGTCALPETCGGGGTPSVCGGASGCVPKTCAELGADCGPMADQCGGLINCGSCALPEICGGAGVPGVCGLLGSNLNDAGACIPTTCAIQGASCGTIGDGCGGTLNCGTCTMGKVCGGGGVPYQCGGGNFCTPLTCASVGATCGSIGDGCGNAISCGSCTAPQVCGGGGVPNQCGGGVTCVPKTCAQLNATCGQVNDGCGTILNCDVGNPPCTGGQACGAGGVPNQCGGQVVCQPKTCAQLGVNCGQVSNGCGTLINCGSCSGAESCGGAGTANVCGAPPPCVPKTCAQQGANCGRVADGCGGLTADCGSCTAPDICGGAGTPSVCGSVRPDAGPCVNLCPNQVACPGNPDRTTLTGVVVAPTQADAGYGEPDPIPNALIYVPNSPLASLDGSGTVTCDQCTDGVSGTPITSTTSATNGSFRLTNVPCGVDVPVVIQLGKWRRVVTVPAPACCQNTELTQEQTRLPRKQAEGHPSDNIPRIAVVTGSVDTIECVLPKIGIAPDQFSLPSGTGRVKFYKDNGANFVGGANTSAATLFDNVNEMRKYDMIILDCVGGEQLKTTARRNNMVAYANAGGRIFASHFAYVWLEGRAVDPNGNAITHNISFSGTATWNHAGDPPNQDAFIDTSFPKGQTFADWVQLVNAQATTSTPATPRIRINTVRRDTSAIIPPAQRWVYGSSGSTTGIPFQYTFNTPTTAPQADQCGRVLFSDFHVINASAANATWPTYCARSPMNPQEKVFEYLIFDLSSCIAPDVPPPQMCTPRTCAQQNIACGQASDGCGGVLNCGTCTSPATCGGGGVTGQCGVPCTPRTCAQLGANCGQQGDGCGGTLNCGTCTSPQTCGGGGTPNVCGGGACVPQTCSTLGYACGSWGNGCGGVTANCGNCPAGQTCGGGGVPGQCGGGMCTALTCADQGFNCGTQGNGCGGTLNCGMCTAPQTCGGGGTPGVCGGGGMCTPTTCAAQSFNCGLQGNGCGGTIDCGNCPPGLICGADGPGRCGAAQCTPLTCAQQNIACGPAGDGCGNIIQCGSCQAPQTCGGGGTPGQCGTPSCTPTTCEAQGWNCGQAANGCGGTLNCGVCPPSQTCGGAGEPNKCGSIG
ncbi:MAG: hypothetical protein DI536_01950 [Archangium gephyra]|uniref:Tryptophan synthase alpha chain n=1 Tax=Archangium gephyra TaxID=48 RepID=A0A2W5TX00_9BACT|nr:MAG: hypothetical protein DI536_01950 [Archangium gephyra]